MTIHITGAQPDGTYCQDGISVDGESGQICYDGSVPANCGELNGKQICVGEAPQGNCTFFPDGSAACDPDAPTPPTPDAGVPGIKANPDLTVGAGNTGNLGDEIDYFTPGTVNGSTTIGDPPGNYDPPGDGDNCTPGVDCPSEWVDRQYDPGEPGSFEAFQVDPNELQAELEQVMPAVDYGAQGGEWSSFFRETFPFSLVAGPLSALIADDAAPTFDWNYGHGHVQLDLSMWNTTASGVKIVLSLLMLWGFWWVVVETLWRAF